MAVPSFMSIPPQDWPMLISAFEELVGTGIHRLVKLARRYSREALICIQARWIQPDPSSARRSRVARQRLSCADVAVQHGRHQTEEIFLREAIGFSQRIDGGLFVGLVGDNVDVVFLQFPLLCGHVR
jgi:hypothetical protein